MHHAMAVGTERAQFGYRVNHARASAGQRVQVVNLDVGTGIGRAVKSIEVETAPHARHAVCPYRRGAVTWIAFVSSTAPNNFAPFSVTARVHNAMSRVFRFNVCLRSGFDIGCQALKAKLKSAGAAFMASTSGLRLLQGTENFCRRFASMIAGFSYTERTDCCCAVRSGDSLSVSADDTTMPTRASLRAGNAREHFVWNRVVVVASCHRLYRKRQAEKQSQPRFKLIQLDSLAS